CKKGRRQKFRYIRFGQTPFALRSPTPKEEVLLCTVRQKVGWQSPKPASLLASSKEQRGTF
ncbi:MAG: hypothetical protein WB983_18545, partial [Terriglobales bacterium]